MDELQNISQRNEEQIGIRVLRQEVGTNHRIRCDAGQRIQRHRHSASTVGADNAALAQASAEVHGVEIRRYQIIYKLFEDIELALHGMLEPKFANRVIGVAEVRQIFKIPRSGLIAGCMIRDGVARRNAKARVKRGEKLTVDKRRRGIAKALSGRRARSARRLRVRHRAGWRQRVPRRRFDRILRPRTRELSRRNHVHQARQRMNDRIHQI